MILRRSVILALGSVPLLTGSAFSQTAVKAHRVGLLSSAAPLTDNSEVVVGLTAGFSKRGYVVGRTLVYERRAAEAHPERLPGLVDDLKGAAELIITQSYAAARVVKDRSNVPVVAITGADPDHSVGELRWITFGLSNRRRLLAVAHTEEGDIIRIISARAATRPERRLYEEG